VESVAVAIVPLQGMLAVTVGYVSFVVKDKLNWQVRSSTAISVSHGGAL
jgi:hypothetical protein